MGRQDMGNEEKITIGMVESHMDVIMALHFPIADNSENRKKFEEHMCQTCSRIRCVGMGRCKATAMTMAQINLLTGLVIFRDEGSPELGIEGFDRITTIGHALRPFNPILADYFDEDDRKNERLHISICLAKKDSNVSLGKLVIPSWYNIKTKKVLGDE